MAGVVFQDDFEVAQINPEGAKFEKVNRLVCKGVVYEIEFLIDVNSELFECEEGDKLTVALATSLSVDGVSEAKAIDYARGAKASLLDQFDYAMHGTVYKFQHVKDTKVEVYPAKSYGAVSLNDSDYLKLMEMNDNHVEYHTVKEFMTFCVGGPEAEGAGEWKSTFPGKYLEGGKEAGGQLVDQRGVVRG